MIAAMVKTMTWAVGNANGQEVDLGDEDAGEDQPERDADEGADQRGDHALVAAAAAKAAGSTVPAHH